MLSSVWLSRGNCVITSVPILQLRNCGPEKLLAKGHTENKWWSWDLKSGQSAFRSLVFFPLHDRCVSYCEVKGTQGVIQNILQRWRGVIWSSGEVEKKTRTSQPAQMREGAGGFSWRSRVSGWLTKEALWAHFQQLLTAVPTQLCKYCALKNVIPP